MKSGIPFGELPKNFQEAIFVARKLGISYLWIDALCIVQDSHQDWTQQASLRNKFTQLLPQYCSNKFCRRCRRSQAGSKCPSYSTVSLPPLNHDDTNPAGWFCYIEPTFRGYLDRRGWVLQERFLSARVFHYLRNQIGWECSENMTSEGLPAGFNFRQTAVNLFKGRNKSILDLDSNGERIGLRTYMCCGTHSSCGSSGTQQAA